MKKSHLGLLFCSLVLFGCNGDAGSSGSGGSTAGNSDGKSLKVGLVFDSGGKGDKSFNDSAFAGVERAKAELGIEEKTVDSRQEKDYEPNLTAMAEQGFNVVVAVGLAQKNAVEAVAPKFPDTRFALIDAESDLPNVRNLVFTEEQGSFLAGYAAGLATKTNKIGFVGGMKVALIEKFEAGYEAGAKMANPNITVFPARYCESWEDVGLAKAAASTLFDQGADIVYQAAGRAGLGVIDAAREKGKLAIGVDGNQDDVAKGNVLTSMIKHVDNAVFQTIKDVKDGKFTSGTKRYTLADGGVGLTDFAFTKDKIGEENIKKIDEIAKKIIAGEIKVPASRAELAK